VSWIHTSCSPGAIALGSNYISETNFFSEKIAIEIIITPRDSEGQEFCEIKKQAAGYRELVLNQQ
jgi:hypothetical protein